MNGFIKGMLTTVTVATIVGVPAYILYKDRQKEYMITGSRNGFAQTNSELRALGIDPTSVSEFLSYTFKVREAVEKELLYHDKSKYSLDKIRDILLDRFNFNEGDVKELLAEYDTLEIFRDDKDALDYLIGKLVMESLDAREFRDIILDLYSTVAELKEQELLSRYNEMELNEEQNSEYETKEI